MEALPREKAAMLIKAQSAFFLSAENADKKNSTNNVEQGLTSSNSSVLVPDASPELCRPPNGSLSGLFETRKRHRPRLFGRGRRQCSLRSLHKLAPLAARARFARPKRKPTRARSLLPWRKHYSQAPQTSPPGFFQRGRGRLSAPRYALNIPERSLESPQLFR